MIIASGPLPASAGVKLFLYACELEDLLAGSSSGGMQFLAQLIIGYSAEREVSLILKHTLGNAGNNQTPAWKNFANLLLLAFSQYSPIQSF